MVFLPDYGHIVTTGRLWNIRGTALTRFIEPGDRVILQHCGKGMHLQSLVTETFSSRRTTDDRAMFNPEGRPRLSDVGWKRNFSLNGNIKTPSLGDTWLTLITATPLDSLASLSWNFSFSYSELVSSISSRIVSILLSTSALSPFPWNHHNNHH